MPSEIRITIDGLEITITPCGYGDLSSPEQVEFWMIDDSENLFSGADSVEELKKCLTHAEIARRRQIRQDNLEWLRARRAVLNRLENEGKKGSPEWHQLFDIYSDVYKSVHGRRP